MVIIARKKPIEVWAARYIDAKIVLDEFLKLLSSNKDEPIRYDGTDDTIYTGCPTESSVIHSRDEWGV